VVLGDQQAPCAGTRARACPVVGHPCLDGIAPDAVVQAVELLITQATPSPQRAGQTPTQATPSPERARLALVSDGREGAST
jgi:hypothetical protein